MSNPLLSDRNIEFLVTEVLKLEELCSLPYFSDHTAETFQLYLRSAAKLARDVVFPTYREMDITPPQLIDGRIVVHPGLKELFPRVVELGVLTASRPAEVGGQQLPTSVAALANGYLMAANLSVFGYLGLTTGAARLLEAFGSEQLKEEFMAPMYDGSWFGTMALTEPQAGSSLADITTTAIPESDGRYRIKGSKIFISGADHDLSENIVHLTLARIEDAPPGIKGISLFAIPKRIPQGETWQDNDISIAGLIHKIGWKAMPSLAVNFGENDQCYGWLVGKPHQGLRYMFQMMNEARLMVGMNAVATASVAYHESLAYAKDRPQGRNLQNKNPQSQPVAIIEHPDVRRMLLRQKAIIEGSLSLVIHTAKLLDLAEHAPTEELRNHSYLLADLLTPLAKTVPSELGYQANVLAVQIHGGYGYTSEYLVESWMRDQKLNTIHEGTTGIQSLDLLGRKVVAQGGAAFQILAQAIAESTKQARASGVEESWSASLEQALSDLTEVTQTLGGFGMQGDLTSMLAHSVHYLECAGIIVLGWQWLLQASAAQEGLKAKPEDAAFYQGKLAAAQYWFHVELPRVKSLAALCISVEDSYLKAQPDWF
jgi:alkylation response protein AidB-like acyl-CoA dehydrogenase